VADHSSVTLTAICFAVVPGSVHPRDEAFRGIDFVELTAPVAVLVDGAGARMVSSDGKLEAWI
jgi:hypothetical protein